MIFTKSAFLKNSYNRFGFLSNWRFVSSGSALRAPDKTPNNEKFSENSPPDVTIMKDSKKFLMSYYPDFVKEMMKNAGKFDSLQGGKHIERVLNYNVMGGKKIRGSAAVQAFAEHGSLRTEADIKLAAFLGWCLETSLGVFMILDDIIDESSMRRGQPCWYRIKDINLTATNDALMLNAAIGEILRDHFGHLKCYPRLYELLNENTFAVSMGQNMDIKAPHEDVLTFTMDRYRETVISKSSYMTFYTPIVAGMYLAGSITEPISQKARSILMDMGMYYQIQDDYHDCYGDSKITDDLGLDIETGKCTWLVVTFLQRATEAQKVIMKESFGKRDRASVQRVKELYDAVGLQEIYASYEEETYSRLRKEIENSREIPVKVCLRFLDKMYKRGF